MSASALSAIARAIQQQGLPEGCQSRTMLRESRDLVCKQKGPYGAILDHVSLQSKEGGLVEISFANPFALLHSAMEASANLQKGIVPND